MSERHNKPMVDANSPTWEAVLAFLVKEREDARAIVDSLNVPEREADAQRGALALLQRLEALPVVPQRIRVSSTTRR